MVQIYSATHVVMAMRVWGRSLSGAAGPWPAISNIFTKMRWSRKAGKDTRGRMFPEGQRVTGRSVMLLNAKYVSWVALSHSLCSAPGSSSDGGDLPPGARGGRWMGVFCFSA